jgi:hypothetical protein
MSSHHIGGRHGRRVKPRAHQVDYIPRGVQIKNSRDGRRYFMKGGERYYVDKEPRKRSEKMTVTQLSALDGAKVYKDGKTFLAQDGAWTDITGKRKGTELGALIPTMFKTGNVTGGGQYVLPRQPFGGVMTPGDKSFTAGRQVQQTVHGRGQAAAVRRGTAAPSQHRPPVRTVGGARRGEELRSYPLVAA